MRADLFDGPERAVLDPKPAFVLQEHDAIPAGEVALAALDRHTHLIAKIATAPHSFARCLIQRTHLIVGVGENDPAALRRRLPVAIPAIDEIVARLLACLGLMHAATIGFQRVAGSAGSQIARGVPLPVLALAANFADFNAAMTLMNGAKGRARLDGLQLPGIADEHNLCASFRGMGQHPFQLARADHACFVDHQNLALA